MSGLQMKYFVLKPAGESPYARASRAAMAAYAYAIREENPKLSEELEVWALQEAQKTGKQDVCHNCDTALPEGCGGTFKDEGISCRLNQL